MSLECPASISEALYRIGGSIPDFNGMYTAFLRVKIVTDLDNYSYFYALTNSNDGSFGDEDNSDAIGTAADGTTVAGHAYSAGSGSSTGSQAYPVGAWHSVALVRRSDTELEFWYDGTQVGADCTQDVSARTAGLSEWISHINGGYPGHIRVEGYKSWSAALSPAEIATEHAYLNAVRTANLIGESRFQGGDKATALVSQVGDNWSATTNVIYSTDTAGLPVYSGGLSLNLTGASAAAQTGSLTQSRTYSASGSAVAAQAGSVAYSTTGAVTLTLAGQAVATQLGSLTQSRTYSASGTAVAAQAGTISPRWQASVGWTDITGEDGYRIKWGTAPDTYTASADVAADTTSYTITGLLFGTTYYTRTYGLLAGVEQEGSVERVLTQNDITLVLSGASATTTAGAISYGLSRTASGQLVTVSPGAIATARTLAPTGAAATAQTGTLAVNTSGGVTAALTGAEATSSAGTVSEGLSLALTGLQITAAPGSVSASSSQGVTLTLSGQAVIATAGSLSTARAATLSGTVATMLPGSVGMPGSANPEFGFLAAICRLAPRGTRLWRACRAAGYPVR